MPTPYAPPSWDAIINPPPAPPAPPRRGKGRHRPRRDPAIRILQTICGTIIIAALLVVIQYGWIFHGSTLDLDTTTSREETPTLTTEHTTETDRTATLRTDDPPNQPEPAEGEPVGWVRAPRLMGHDWRYPVVQGVAQSLLDRMWAGHYPSTAMPGGVGNSAIAGHDIPAGFGGLYDTQDGDQLIIETDSTWYVYTAMSTSIVDRSQVQVIDPLPGVGRALTLQTCWPMFTGSDTGQRFIIHARFLGWAPKSEGVPPILAQTHPTTVERAGRVVRTVAATAHVPNTAVMAAGLALMWLVADGVAWALTWRRTLDSWEGSMAGPVGWVWRLQAGQLPGPVWVAWLPRLVPTVLFLMAATLGLWWGVCPWVAAHVPGMGVATAPA